MIKHIGCDNLVEREGITLYYDYYCPSCDEDLCLSECSFETINGYKSFEELVKFVTNETDILVKRKENTYTGERLGVQSSVEFEYAADCYVYCYDFANNGYKSI